MAGGDCHRYPGPGHNIIIIITTWKQVKQSHNTIIIFRSHVYSSIHSCPSGFQKPSAPLKFFLFDSSYVWPGIKCLTHLSPWQFTSLYFPSHCRGQEAVFIRAQDAEIVSCLCSCQFQLVREQLSPIGQTQIGDTFPALWLVTSPFPGLWLVEIPPPCGRD